MNIEYVKNGLAVDGMEVSVQAWEQEGLVIHWFRDETEIAMATILQNGEDWEWTRFQVNEEGQGIFTAAQRFAIQALSNGYSLTIKSDVFQNQFYKEVGYEDRGDGYLEFKNVKVAEDWIKKHGR